MSIRQRSKRSWLAVKTYEAVCISQTEKFSVTSDDCLRVFVTTAFLEEWGVKLQSAYLHHLIFADNCWLFATSMNMLSRMIKALVDALTIFGWDMPLQEACWCTTLADNISGELNITGVTVKRELRAIGFKALGTRITLDGRCRVEIENRIDRSWAAFFSKKHLLLCHAASVVARLKLLQRLVPHTLFWCAGSWHPTQGDLRRLRSTQLAMARKII